MMKRNSKSQQIKVISMRPKGREIISLCGSLHNIFLYATILYHHLSEWVDFLSRDGAVFRNRNISNHCLVEPSNTNLSPNLICKMEMSSVSSVTYLCPTLCDPMNCSTPGFPVHHQLPELLNSCPSSWWCHPTIASSVIPFSYCLQSFPASGSFPRSQFFASGGQSIGASPSASVRTDFL